MFDDVIACCFTAAGEQKMVAWVLAVLTDKQLCQARKVSHSALTTQRNVPSHTLSYMLKAATCESTCTCTYVYVHACTQKPYKYL